MKSQIYIIASLLLLASCRKKQELLPDPVEIEVEAATAVSGTYYSTRASYYWSEPRPVAIIKDSMVISELAVDSVRLTTYINTVNDDITLYKILKVKKKDNKTYDLFRPDYKEYPALIYKDGEISVSLGDGTVVLFFNKKKK